MFSNSTNSFVPDKRTQATGLLPYVEDVNSRLPNDCYRITVTLPPFAVAGLNRLQRGGHCQSIARINLAVLTLATPRFNKRIRETDVMQIHKTAENVVDLNNSGGSLLLKKMPKVFGYISRSKVTVYAWPWTDGWLSQVSRYAHLTKSDIMSCLHAIAQESNYIKGHENVAKAAKEYSAEFFYQVKTFARNQKHEFERCGVTFDDM